MKENNIELEANKNKIIETLRDYKIKIAKIEVTIGPTVTLYEVTPAPGVKFAQIKKLNDDKIALSLNTSGVRIYAPVQGVKKISIELPNQNPTIVPMSEVIASKQFQESELALPVALGRTIANEIYMFNLVNMPHLLIACANEQEKSNGLNTIITSLLYKKHPSQLKFVMIDSEKMNLSIYSKIEKHFLAKLPSEKELISSESSKSVSTMNSLCAEMDYRFKLLLDAQVQNIQEYNDKFIKSELNHENGHKYLPYIVVIIDEFADFRMTAGEKVVCSIVPMAQRAHAVGIHLILATQRPATNIITGIIKANFPSRIAFKVASKIESNVVLDAPGAHQLIGNGDMLISINDDVTRVQCASIDANEIESVIEYISTQQFYSEEYILQEYVPSNVTDLSNETNLNTRDELFEEVARYIVSNQKGSTSSIQRHFGLGYNRAGRIMEQLEKAGIVGKSNEDRPREVLIKDIKDL